MIAGKIRKQEDEVFDLVLDLTYNLFGGTVSSAVVTALNEDGTTEAGIIDGSPTIDSPYVTQRIEGGTAGETYYINFLTTMSGGQVVEDEIIVVMEGIPV